MEVMNKTKIGDDNSDPEAIFGNEILYNASGGSRSSDSVILPTKLVGVNFQNISTIKLGTPENCDSWDRFTRIPPKHILIEELEWKPARTFPLKEMLFIVVFSMALFLYLGFKLKKELRVSFGPKVVPLHPAADTGILKARTTEIPK
jgi:hypothetical protein